MLEERETGMEPVENSIKENNDIQPGKKLEFDSSMILTNEVDVKPKKKNRFYVAFRAISNEGDEIDAELVECDTEYPSYEALRNVGKSCRKNRVVTGVFKVY